MLVATMKQAVDWLSRQTLVCGGADINVAHCTTWGRLGREYKNIRKQWWSEASSPTFRFKHCVLGHLGSGDY